jgi:hypothetical protein
MLTFAEFIKNASEKTISFTPAEAQAMRERAGDAALEIGQVQEDGSLIVPVGYLLEAAQDLIDFQDDSDILFEMSNLRQQDTGLPFVVWISVKGGARHDLRVKVSRGLKARPSEMVSVAIRPHVRVVGGSLSASDLKLLHRWVKLNLDTLVKYWDGKIDTKTAVNTIRPINP